MLFGFYVRLLKILEFFKGEGAGGGGRKKLWAKAG